MLKDKATGKVHSVFCFLALLILGVQTTTGALGDETPLQSLKPSLDSTTVKKTVLNAEINQSQDGNGSEPAATGGTSGAANEPDGGSPPSTVSEPGTGAHLTLSAGSITLRDLVGLMHRAASDPQFVNIKINSDNVFFGNFGRRTPTMSKEQFRKLEYGVIGMVSIVRQGVPGPLVTKVYPTCPAADAGIMPGDVVVQTGDHVYHAGDGQREMWRSIVGKAGTPVDVTVLRDGKEIVFHLVRMNIEDISDSDIRYCYECLLSAYGSRDQ